VKRRKHWYFISIWYCPICSKTETYRERRYGHKPKKRAKTHEYNEVYDYCNAL
jgi:hypothetical protein